MDGTIEHRRSPAPVFLYWQDKFDLFVAAGILAVSSSLPAICVAPRFIDGDIICSDPRRSHQCLVEDKVGGRIGCEETAVEIDADRADEGQKDPCQQLDAQTCAEQPDGLQGAFPRRLTFSP
ncbi:hypothetical protein [Rhizobium ruizarguesonis]|uniref:hypothetical protein n=1 Tax=Rhizobium ruizarguesonis TaxID=2081791 RepID=UPI0031451C0F